MTETRMALPLCAIVALGVTGCDNTADKQREADQAQLVADQKRVSAEEQARQKAAEAQNAAQQQATQAQRQADEKANAALALLSREQVDVLAKVNGAIEDLNGKVNDLQAASNAEKTPGKKDEDGKVLADLSARRDVLVTDGKAIAQASATTWPALKEQIDKDLGDYKSLARMASVHIKAAPR